MSASVQMLRSFVLTNRSFQGHNYIVVEALSAVVWGGGDPAVDTDTCHVLSS